jgi:hypothetical protein
VRAFLSGLGPDIPIQDRIALFNVLRKQDMLADLSRGTAQLFFTPGDVDLSIESKSPVP